MQTRHLPRLIYAQADQFSSISTSSNQKLIYMKGNIKKKEKKK